MQIKDNQQRQWNWTKVKIYFYRIIYLADGKRRPAFVLALAFSFLITLFAFGNFTAGVIAQRNYAVSNMLFKPLILDNYNILIRKFHSLFVQRDILTIDVKYKELQKLEFLRQNSIISGSTVGNQEWVKAMISNKGQTFKAKIRLKGGMADEHMEGDKWSFRVKISGNNTIFGMEEFALMSPMRRNLLGEWFIRKVYEKEGLISRKYEFVEVVINGKSKGIYVIDERYDNIMLERNHRKEGPVIKVDASPIFMDKIGLAPSDRDNYYLSMDYTAFDLKKFLQNEQLRKMFFKAKNLFEQFRAGLLSTSEIFDIEKLAKWTAISDVMGAWHGFGFSNMRFYYNPVTSKFEPVPDDNYNERAFNYASNVRVFRYNDIYNKGKFLKQLFSDYSFTELYLKELERVSQESYLDQRFGELHDEIMKNSYILAKDYPLYNFLLESKGYTYDNAKSLRNILNPSKGVQAYYHEKDDEKIVLKIANNKSIPMEILYLKYEGDLFKPKSKEKLILTGRDFGTSISYQDHVFELPYSFELLDFEQFDQLQLVYRVLGTEKIRTAEIFPYPAFDKNFLGNDIQRKVANFRDYNFLTYNAERKEIVIENGNWTINKDLIIPKAHTLHIGAGANIDLIESAMILSYSPLIILGLEDYPVNIFSSDSTGQGITVIKAGGESLMKYVTFRNLSAPNRPEWELTGSINFYESPVNMYETHYEGNIAGDDYINLIRSEFTIDRSSTSNTFADALDADFCNGKIMNSKFSNCGNNSGNSDCLDFSGSVIDINNVIVKNAGDKGLSLGEETIVTIHELTINNTKIAIAVKDNSTATIDKMSINKCQIGIIAFQKKPEFGPAAVSVTNLSKFEVGDLFIIEKGSSASVDGTEIDAKYQNVRDLIY